MKKVISAAVLLVAVLWGSTLLAAPVRSQEAGAPLTDDTLRQMLDGMGYSPKALSKGYLIAIQRDGWTYNIQLLLSPDKTKVGFNSNLGGVEDPDSVTAVQWRNLVAGNQDVDPSFFYFDKVQKKLYLHRSLDNLALTPAYLRTQVENFCSNIKDTADLWKFTK